MEEGGWAAELRWSDAAAGNRAGEATVVLVEWCRDNQKEGEKLREKKRGSRDICEVAWVVQGAAARRVLGVEIGRRHKAGGKAITAARWLCDSERERDFEIGGRQGRWCERRREVRWPEPGFGRH